MKPSEIQVGKTYVNKGAGRTRRKVIDIGPQAAPQRWRGDLDRMPAPGTPGVIYQQLGDRGEALYTDRLFINAFAAWAGKEAP